MDDVTCDGNQLLWNQTELYMGSAGTRLQFTPVLLPLSCSAGGCRRNHLHIPAQTLRSKVSVIIFLSPRPCISAPTPTLCLMGRRRENTAVMQERKRCRGLGFGIVGCFQLLFLFVSWFCLCVFVLLHVVMIVTPLFCSFCSNIALFR